MLQLFRGSQPYLAPLLAVYALLLRIGLFSAGITVPAGNSGVLATWFERATHLTYEQELIAALVLTVVQALLLNYYLNQYKVTKEYTYVPALMYVLFTSIVREYALLTPALWANTFIIVAWGQLLQLSQKGERIGATFDVGFWLGIASCFYLSAGCFVLWAVISLVIFRSPNLREVIILLTGFVMPYILLGVGFFWLGRLGDFWQEQVLRHLLVFRFHTEAFDWLLYLRLAVIVVLIGSCFLSFSSLSGRGGSRATQIVSSVFWAMLITLPTLAFQATISVYHLVLLAMPVATVLGSAMLTLRRKLTAELLHLVLLLTVIVLQYQHLLFE